MSDDHLRDKIVQYFIVGLLAAVILFLVFGLAKGDGDNKSADKSSTPAAPAAPRIPAKLMPQVGCQQPTTATTTAPAKGKQTIPPNPGVSARRSGHTGTISVTIPTSTQECRVAKVRVQLDSTTDKIAATSNTVSTLTGPPVRKIKLTLPKGAGVPQIARAFAITPDGRSSSGATVSIR
jgi:hypothetical protein